MIDRREFMQGAALAVIAGSSAQVDAAAGPVAQSRIARVGILGESNPIGWIVRTAAVEIEYRWADERRERLSDLAAELVALDVDVIVAAGARAARAARQATQTIPIVFVSSGDPVKDGLVASLAKPGGNVTGLWVVSEVENVRRQVKLLRDVVPGLARIAVLCNPSNVSNAATFARVREVVESQAIHARRVEARGSEDFALAVAKTIRERAGGLLVLPDPLFAIHARRLVGLAAASRLPAVYGARSFVEAGGLMALHADTAEVIRRTAALVTRIVKGVTPASVPVELYIDLELTVNAGAARTLGLALPRSLLASAVVVA